MARPATVEDLVSKPARTQTITLTLGGEEVEVELTAISGDAYDELLSDHPPTKAQREEGETFNAETFAPALIAAVVSAPKLSLEQATTIWSGSTWSRGELTDLYVRCLRLCSQGLDVPFTSAG